MSLANYFIEIAAWLWDSLISLSYLKKFMSISCNFEAIFYKSPFAASILLSSDNWSSKLLYYWESLWFSSLNVIILFYSMRGWFYNRLKAELSLYLLLQPLLEKEFLIVQKTINTKGGTFVIFIKEIFIG